ncbi:SANT/Myb_domain [Hexamita inflata]|uniref:SANT/Myb domain n=1 Tax=Hexamita inflata TaxID=28002 RepID=A0AA86U032_9EUKA|nr:SANT/Myb domain [Hexamita inflata]
MTQRRIIETLQENIQLTQAIHYLNHAIEEIQFESCKSIRQRWTISEISLFDIAVQLFGDNNIEKLAQVIVSKSKSQIYFRIKYLNNKRIKQQNTQINNMQNLFSQIDLSQCAEK